MAQDGKAPAAMREVWVRSLGKEDPLEKGMATPSSIRAWRIPWTESHGPQSTGSPRVRHSSPQYVNMCVHICCFGDEH